ncbi:haspin like kinase domain-containing protein [Ditylenchus destructor]|nr:haspin like kinase domain-containing protein [Ditylenchus destructor]
MTRPGNIFGVPTTSSDDKNSTESKITKLETDIRNAIKGVRLKQPRHFARPIMKKLRQAPPPIEQPDQTQAVPPTVTFDELLAMCDPSEVGTWDDILDDGHGWTKIAEGSYGDVYSGKIDNEDRIVKIIPFVDVAIEKGPLRMFTADQPMMTANDLASELATARALHELHTMECAELMVDTRFGCPNFVHLVAARVIRSNYPPALLDAFKLFKENNKERAINPLPTIYQPKNGAQLYLVQVMEKGGEELEEWLSPAGCPNKTQKRIQRLRAGSIFFQLALSLLAAEEKMQFEHRDMHLSNILISDVEEEYVKYCINGELVKLKTMGVRATIIDYTHSRILAGGRLFFTHMGALGLCDGHGSQAQVYTNMRARNGDNWANFTPASNMLWLKYLATKLFDDFSVLRDAIVKKLDEAERIQSFLGSELMREILYRYLYG